MSLRLGLICSFLAGTFAMAAAEDKGMPAAEQNALVRKYCAVCHTDAAKNGGLSLEHFDIEMAPPSLTAMLLSKITGGASLQTVAERRSNSNAAALVDQKMKSGALGAAGLRVPDKAAIDGLIDSLGAKSAGATGWTIEHSNTLTASSLRQIASSKSPGEAESYRLVVSCNPTTREGEMQLAWSPVPQSGALAVSVDGRATVRYRVEGSETMGNGNGAVLHRLAAVSLPGLALPDESLTVTDLFPGETVTFSFSSFPERARAEFRACFLQKSAAEQRR